jgi:hypothetical protein
MDAPMKLASIINVWSDCLELLPYAINNHMSFCDGVIVVWSSTSNHGNSDDGKMIKFIIDSRFDQRTPDCSKGETAKELHYEQLEPINVLTPLANETRKRNHGIDVARKKGFTHFLIADADEFYEPDLMHEGKKRFYNPSLNGLVHPLKVYIKSPTLWTYDHTLCAGINKLNHNTQCGNFNNYPFAYDAEGKAHIDPSRRINYTSGIEMSPVCMHHMSYVRKNIDLKIDNSSANLRRSRQVIYDEMRDAKPGYLSKLYHQELKSCDNYFNLPIWN